MRNARQYLKIARPDHWIKHVFVLPGLALSLVISESPQPLLWVSVALGVLSACLIASANYVINEWLDANFDRFHPLKKERPAALGQLRWQWVYIEYAFLTGVGLLSAIEVNRLFFATTVAFLVSGLVYNVRPFRLKDRKILDVLIESINNPIRLVLGWSMVSDNTLPPSSLLASYWFSAAFLMATKRLGEYRYLKSRNQLTEIGLYRRSFRFYTEESLAVSSFLYALVSLFFVSMFLTKYRHEFLFIIPSIIGLFSYYYYLALRHNSLVQMPEKVHRDTRLMLIVLIILLQVVFFSFVDIPLARVLVESRIMSIDKLGTILPFYLRSALW